jgi:hypothetical protein
MPATRATSREKQANRRAPYGAFGTEGSNQQAVLPELGATPLITSRGRVREMMKAAALEVGRRGGKPVKLVRFTCAEMMWTSMTR